MLRTKIYISLAITAVAAVIWSSDSVTLQGERTIYTADCDSGRWASNTCSGRMLAGNRYRYRALKAHGEVFFWIFGSSTEPSGKLVDCTIQDGRNWSCPATNIDAARTVTIALKYGHPVSNPAWPTRPLHSVSKVAWYMLKIGINLRQTDDPTY